jgi:DnaJ-class molecular chaperone
MAGFNPFGGGQGRAQGGPNANFDDLFSTFSRGGGGRFSHSRRTSGPSGSFGEQAGAEDILRSMFGADGPLGGGAPGGGQQHSQTRRRHTKGADIKANVRVSLDDIVAGEKITVSLPGQGSVKIALPKGVEAGQTIRLKGKGAESPDGGKPGDGLVTVHFAAHPVFKADGETLTMDLPVTLDEAVLGARISVATLDGTVSLNLPAGTQSGRTLRLKERGLPGKSGKRGDLLVKVLIKLPEESDEALEVLMRRWRSDGRYSVR